MKMKVSEKHRIHTQNRSTDQVEVVKILNGYEMFKCTTLSGVNRKSLLIGHKSHLPAKSIPLISFTILAAK